MRSSETQRKCSQVRPQLGLPVEAELLLMIKGPLVTQAEKSSSDPRWKRGAGWNRAASSPQRPPTLPTGAQWFCTQDTAPFPTCGAPGGSFPKQGQRLVPYRGSAWPVPPPPVPGVCTGSGGLPRGSAVVLSITAEPLKAHEDKAPLSHTLQPPAQPQESVLLSSLRKPEPDDQKGHLSRRRAPW